MRSNIKPSPTDDPTTTEVRSPTGAPEPTPTSEPAPADADSDPDTTLAVTGVAPSFAMGTLYQTISAAVGMSHQNAVHAQSLQYALNNAVALESLGALHSSHRRRPAQLDPRIESTLDRVVRVLDSLNVEKPKPT